MATEYRLVSFRQPLEGLIPPVSGGVKVLTIDMLGSVPELAEYMDGWELVSSQFLLLNDIEYVVTFTLKMTVNAPDTAEELS